MNRNDGVYDTDDRSQPNVPNQHNDRLLASLEKDIARRESAVIDNEAAVLSREKLVSAREYAVQLRENAPDSREHAVPQHEGKPTEKMQSASDEHMLMLRQANAHLIIATIEAQQLTEQFKTAKDLLNCAKITAEKANLEKSNFLSSMSHELRTPLNAILGFAQLLEAGSPPPTDTQKVRLQQITKAGWYLLELINEILDIAGIESGKLSLSLEPVSLIEIMRDCQALIKPQAQTSGISINILPFDCTWFAYADRTRVKQALINLLSNAIKYNRAHGTVEVECTLSTPKRVRISVKDHGAGLPPEKLAQLFQSFNRLGQETGTEQGTGLGLVVTKRLVELMGGTIGVESTVGVGSEFWIELIRDVTPQLAAENTLSEELDLENRPSRTLLYEEDDPAGLMLTEQIPKNDPHTHILSPSAPPYKLSSNAPAEYSRYQYRAYSSRRCGCDGRQLIRHQRNRNYKNHARRPGNEAHSHHYPPCQCNAPRYRKGTNAGLFRHIQPNPS